MEVDNEDELEMLGAEALCILHLAPDEVAAAVDQDLSTSTSWLLGALGRAMDRENTRALIFPSTPLSPPPSRARRGTAPRVRVA